MWTVLDQVLLDQLVLDGDGVRSTSCGMVWKSIMNGIGPTCSVVMDTHGWLVLDQRIGWS